MRLFLAALLFTGCATEADRYCPVIRSQGVAAPGVPGAACTDGTAACPAGMQCRNNVCTVPCSRSSECRALGSRGVCFDRSAACVQSCESDGDCAAGTMCREAPPTTWTPCSDSTACYPRRFCVMVICG